MKLSTCLIFLILICILFDLNYCRNYNRSKGGKNDKLCRNFCEQEIISTDGKTINLFENNLKRYKRSPRGESKSKKKSWFEKLCCCGDRQSQDPPSSSPPQDPQYVEGKGKEIAPYVARSSSSSDDSNLSHRERKALIKAENIGSTSSPVKGKKAV
uniref:Uncharacterized protein n=1 Tax=Meloidogyne floridensis TaxID=298350 RepID=A0A915NJP3_9BILA